MAQEAELLYKTVQWDESLLQQIGKMAAGPLFNIQSPDGAVSQLHLPHCETMNAPLPEGLLSVVHITDDGMNILEPLEITDTHVVVNIPHLSAFGLVWDLVKRFHITPPIRGQVLLSLQPHGILSVFLLQDNIPLDEVAAQQGEAKNIKSSSNCHLRSGQSYRVHCEPKATIQPEHAPFRTQYGPKFNPTFEVFLTTNQEKVTLMVQDQEGTQVWKRVLTGQKKKNLPTGYTITAKRAKMTKMDLLNILEDLEDDEFKNFKWFLKNEKVDDIEPIKENQLEKAERRDTVDLMVQKYDFPRALKVMKSILKKINRNDLVRKLSNISSGAEAGGIMTKPEVELFKILANLKEDEFKAFKWFLAQGDILEGFKGIPKSRLEKAGRRDTVDLMILNHQDHGALQLTKKVLRKIKRNDLVQRFQNSPSGPKGPGPAETPSVPADEKLKSVRIQFVDRVSEPNLHKLLDKLLQRRVINDGEMEFAGTLNRADKARQVIDMVRGKGPKASSALIAALCEVDPFLSKELNLQ